MTAQACRIIFIRACWCSSRLRSHCGAVHIFRRGGHFFAVGAREASCFDGPKSAFRGRCRRSEQLHFDVQFSWQAQPGSADFVAGAAFCEPQSADFAAGAALCEPGSVNSVASAAVEAQSSQQAQPFVSLEAQISWQAQQKCLLHRTLHRRYFWISRPLDLSISRLLWFQDL